MSTIQRILHDLINDDDPVHMHVPHSIKMQDVFVRPFRGLHPLHPASAYEAPKPPPEPKPNAVVYPTLAGLGFIFPEGVTVGSIVEPPQRCQTCGHECERVAAP